jgi:hypothetical protein
LFGALRRVVAEDFSFVERSNIIKNATKVISQEISDVSGVFLSMEDSAVMSDLLVMPKVRDKIELPKPQSFVFCLRVLGQELVDFLSARDDISVWLQDGDLLDVEIGVIRFQ